MGSGAELQLQGQSSKLPHPQRVKTSQSQSSGWAQWVHGQVCAWCDTAALWLRLEMGKGSENLAGINLGKLQPQILQRLVGSSAGFYISALELKNYSLPS